MELGNRFDPGGNWEGRQAAAKVAAPAKTLRLVARTGVRLRSESMAPSALPFLVASMVRSFRIAISLTQNRSDSYPRPRFSPRVEQNRENLALDRRPTLLKTRRCASQ
jgi:hypothetical protein